MQEESCIRVLCVDDHPIVLQGLAHLISMESDMMLLGCATSGEEAVEIFQRYRPDVTLMDLQLPTMSGLEAIRLIRSHDSDARIIVLTMYDGDEDIRRAINAGASTYLFKKKETVCQDLVRTIREIHVLSRKLPSHERTSLGDPADHPTLTSREQEVLQLTLDGLRNKEVAVVLGITEQTVYAHVRNVFAKLGVHDRTAAVATALRRGIIHLKSQRR